ncbi:hypothetical protein BD779DRAFT_1676407 [Infundibulicybe gibba]|nr:hypothetical protein BD779DRAFT_1676407 [Infundibulicybe gibba]
MLTSLLVLFTIAFTQGVLCIPLPVPPTCVNENVRCYEIAQGYFANAALGNPSAGAGPPLDGANYGLTGTASGVQTGSGLLGGALGSGVSTLLDGVNYGLTGTTGSVKPRSGLLGGALGSGVGTLLDGVNYGLTGTTGDVQTGSALPDGALGSVSTLLDGVDAGGGK